MTMEEGNPISRAAAWGVHVYTASGVVFALLATLEACSSTPDARFVFLWLCVAVLIDATDGPLARRVRVKEVVPHIHGRTIDDIVDYLTFTFIPLLLIARMEWVPQPTLLFVAPPLIASLLGFANAGAKDEVGGFFLGFPSYWNIVAFYAGLLAAADLRAANAVMLLVLAVLTVTPVGFIYPNLAPPRWRAAILGGAFVWTVILLLMLPKYPNASPRIIVASLIFPVFYTALSISEFVRYKRSLSPPNRA